MTFSFGFIGSVFATNLPPAIQLPRAVQESDVADKSKQWNRKMSELRSKRDALYAHVNEEFSKGVKEEKLYAIVTELKSVKREIQELEEKWRKISVEETLKAEDGYGFWDLGETTLSNLVMEYGSQDYVYIIPQNLTSIKLHLHSAVPIPKESWAEMVDLILSQNGIGIRKVNSFVKQLYMMKQHAGLTQGIAHRKEDLELFADGTRIAYVFSPRPEELKSSQSFFERFSDVNTTVIHLIGHKIIIVSEKQTVESLLDLYEAVWVSEQAKVVKIISLSKLGVKEAQQLIESYFQPKNIKVRPSFYQKSSSGLMTMVLNQGLALIGDSHTVKKAEQVLAEIEKQLDQPSQMTAFWYTCRHSDPNDLAQVLERVYESLSQVAIHDSGPDHRNDPLSFMPPPEKHMQNKPKGLPVQPKFIEPGRIENPSSAKEVQSKANFIVDPKTTSILMVIRKDLLAEIKKIIQKIDVPKQMVHIEVLLVEKKIQERNQAGINLLKIGSPASDTKKGGVQYDTRVNAIDKGIFSFLFSRPQNSLPAFDLVYNFLMAQDNIRINANPSVVAINQTPATISITEELSINNGAVLLEGGSQGVTAEQSYTRAQYGIVIVMTPTVHLPDPDSDDQTGYVTLSTDVTFDTTQISRNDRPPVTRRHVENEVRIADGETIILGGLKRQSSENSHEKVPFLGDIPGLGKLFGSTNQTDNNTEMFIFITPRIIKNDLDAQRKLRQEELKKRPGDIPVFLDKLKEAQENESKNRFEQSLKMLFN